jgi:hypothetical protein
MAGEIGLIRMEQGATAMTVPSSCFIDIEDGGYVKVPVVADTSSANLANFGMSTLNVDSSAPTTFTLDAPTVGVVKHIYINDGISASGIGYIYAGASVTIASSASSTNSFLRVDTLDSRVSLIGLTTASWALIYKSTGITTTTGTS